jgi:hypothetical protein
VSGLTVVAHVSDSLGAVTEVPSNWTLAGPTDALFDERKVMAGVEREANQ